MNLKKQFSVILTLAVAFMMLVVPLSTALGGGGSGIFEKQSERW